MGIFDTMFGINAANSPVKQMIDNGAVIIDVRTVAEFQGGHVAGSRNIPLQNIQHHVDEIKNINKPIVLCCASGGRSGQATSFLSRHGIECMNGGGWTQVNALVR
ncbi:MAG: rhodanese-like domain-containing protein [Flavobacteriales bacterium]|nr:rhodanese-like domain-containing protein [Flavobacteriales bacterium]